MTPLLLALLACRNDKDLEETGEATEVCDDAIDNDGDGDVDCEDSDCQDDPACDSAGVEDCGDGADNDGDGDIDCDDADCAGEPECEQAIEDCSDGVDNDDDGDIDCDDADCADDPACQLSDEDCSDGADNDGDGFVDCEDSDCTEVCDEDCTDGVDNDADGFIDCLDNECSSTEECVEDCTDGVDNDGNGLVDCEDAACASDAACIEDCSDTVDNDLDGFIDCEDDDCWGTSECFEKGVQVLSHGGGSGYLQRNQRSFYLYVPGSTYSYGYSVSFANSATFTDIEGTLQTLVEGAEVSCNWSVDGILMGRSSPSASYSGFYYQALGMDLVLRSGFQTSGACGGVSSGFLPTKFGIDSYNGVGATTQDTVQFSSFKGPLWYAGGLGVTTSSTYSSGGGPIPGGGYSYFYSYFQNASLTWSAGGRGEVWTP